MRQLMYFFTCMVLVTACDSQDSQEETSVPAPNPAIIYNPYLSTLTIRSEIDYPSGFKAVLYDDREREELASAVARDGRFVLQVPALAANEVYFLILSGKRRAFGIDGMDWEERVPVYFRHGTSELTLVGSPYSGVESVSRMRFHIEGDEVQETLNKWQEANNNHAAAIENQVAQQVTLGSITSTKKQERRESLKEGLDRISREMIAADSPNVATLFLIYRQNDHRERHGFYQEVYSHTSKSAQQSKYGVDLARRIDKIHSPVEAIDIVGDSVLANGRLMPLDTAALGASGHWLLYFWSTRGPASIEGIPGVQETIDELDPGKVVPIFVSVDERFSRWREQSQELDLPNSYFIRKHSRQSLINTLYLTEVPRIVLMLADGTVLDDDVDLEKLPVLLSRE